MAIRVIENRIEVDPQVGEVYIGKHIFKSPQTGEEEIADMVAMRVDRIHGGGVITSITGLMDDPKIPEVQESYVYRFRLAEFRSGKVSIYKLFTSDGQDLTQAE